MGTSASLRSADVREIFRLVGECRDLGDDSGAWYRHLAGGLVRLTGPSLVLAGELGGLTREKPYLVGVEMAGWENGFDRANLTAALAEFSADPFYCPPVNAYLQRMKTERRPALARSDMLLDSEWYRSHYFRNFHHLIGADAVMFCLSPLPREPDRCLGLELLRPSVERDYSARQKAIVREIGGQLEPLLGGALARFEEPRPSRLPPRGRQVLRCLLEGDSGKQIALRLGIGFHTANDHIRAVFRHFGVRTRSELMSRWVRRGWGLTGQW